MRAEPLTHDDTDSTRKTGCLPASATNDSSGESGDTSEELTNNPDPAQVLTKNRSDLLRADLAHLDLLVSREPSRPGSRSPTRLATYELFALRGGAAAVVGSHLCRVGRRAQRLDRRGAARRSSFRSQWSHTAGSGPARRPNSTCTVGTERCALREASRRVRSG